jgi:outer membrane protein assembly factor BamB
MSTDKRVTLRLTLAAVWAAWLILSFVSVSAAQQWTRFRGPNGSGTSAAVDLPETWSDDDYNWRVTLPGVGNSSPVVWGDMIYVTSNVEKDGMQIVTCLRTSDGGRVWRKDFKASTYKQHALNLYASSTPTVDEKRLYVTWASTREYIVAAFDRLSVKELWRRDLGPAITRHGFGGSPMLYEGMVIVTKEQCEWGENMSKKESFTVALDCSTGKTRWKAPRRTKETSYSTPCVYRPKNGPPQLIFSSLAHGLSSIDPLSGKTNWELDVFEKRSVASPLLVGDMIFASCGSGGGGKRMVAVRAGNPAQNVKPHVVYDIKGSLPYVPTCIAHEGLLFVWADKGVVTCLDVATGKEHWRERVGGNFFGSPVKAAGRLYCMSRDGVMVVLKAKKTFEPPTRIELGEPSNSTPAISDGKMYLRTRSRLMSIGGK